MRASTFASLAAALLLSAAAAPTVSAQDASLHLAQWGYGGWHEPYSYGDERPRHRHYRNYDRHREFGYRASNGRTYPYCVVDLGYGRVEACGSSNTR